MSKTSNYLLPYSFKNSKQRVQTSTPKLDKSGNPIIKNGAVVMTWANAKDPVSGKPAYSEDLMVTFVPVDGKVIPSVLSKSMINVLINDAKSNEKTLLTKPNSSYTLDREFDPQDTVDSDDNTITTITVKYRPSFQPVLSTISKW